MDKDIKSVLEKMKAFYGDLIIPKYYKSKYSSDSKLSDI